MPTLRTIQIAATFTSEPLLPSLEFVLQRAGVELAINVSPYNQVFQQLLSSSSLFAKNVAGANVLILRVADLVRDVDDGTLAETIISSSIDELILALKTFADRAQVPTIVSVLDSSRSDETLSVHFLEATKARLSACVQSLPGLVLLPAEEIDVMPNYDVYDDISDELAHIPFTQHYFSSLAIALARKLHAALVPAQKVLVLDCDNTLWKGVIGEDGIDGIQITPAFATLQKFALRAHSEGALLCLVSKNTEEDVVDVLEQRKDMLIRRHHIVAQRINWNDKPSNVSSLARALNLGLDSFVFIDDNPVECEQMRTALPQVVTLQLPPEPEIETFLNRLWIFDKIFITEEDTRRTQMYKEDSARQHSEKVATNLQDFIASLQVVADIGSPRESDWPRLAQLTQRTNQFNFTTRRRTESELRSLIRDGFEVLRVNVKDRFGDYGLVGLVILHDESAHLCVDTLLLSCRVLGRGVEHTILRELAERAAKRGLSAILVPFISTEKNEPASAFLESVAAQFRVNEGNDIDYVIPTDWACAITHRSGEDPDAVIRASKSGEAPQKANVFLDQDRSERYSALANLTADRVVQELAHNVRQRPIQTALAAAETDTEIRMLELWERTLGVTGLGIDDDYFAVGGTSLKAVELFSQISRRFQVELQLTTILNAPTVRALCRHVEARSYVSAIVELRASPKASKTLFLVHDGDGEVLLYSNLAKRLSKEIAVFGVSPQKATGIPLAHTRIEDMAGNCVDRIRDVQPRGPFIIGGMCAGGVIAYEMTRQLLDAGEDVECVFLLDAATPQAPKQFGRVAKNRFRRFGELFVEPREGGFSSFKGLHMLIGAAIGKIRNTVVWELADRTRRLSVRFRFQLLDIILRRRLRWPAVIPNLTVRQIYECAEAHYRPGPNLGAKVALIRATVGEGGDTPYRQIYASDTFGWEQVHTDLSVSDVKGGHFSMLQEPYVEDLSNTIEQLILADRSHAWTQVKRVVSA